MFPWKKTTVYGVVLLLTIIIVIVFPDYGNTVLSIVLASCIAIGVIYYFVCISIFRTPSSNTKTAESAVSIELLQTKTVETSSSTITPSKPRLYYLDNLKSILTAIVVITHINEIFSGGGQPFTIGNYYNPFIVAALSTLGISQSYYMCLFFFISGYFVPTSYDRKGFNKFLRDKFKRIGVPFIFNY
eukprot:526007_1